MKPTSVSRRRFLSRSAAGIMGLGLWSPVIAAISCGSDGSSSGADDFGDLQPPDANGLRLPPGFVSRIVARSGEVVANTGYVWHANPDGGATFATEDGGWVYVSNAEAPTTGAGGVGVLRFDADANVVDAYRILSGTTRNCAGGRTPWQTWLSCEEIPTGRVFECDPLAPSSQGSVRPALGVFQHEAAAVDPAHHTIYLTEDRPDSLLYRFTASQYPNLQAGVLEAAQILDPNDEGPIVPGQSRPLAWHVVPDPLATRTATRYQVPLATRFDGGEGIDHHAGQIFFSTKGDDRVWMIDTANDRIEIRYDRASSSMPELSGVDNVYLTSGGDIYVAEDPGDLQIVALTTTGKVKPVVQVMNQSGSEITGPALSPNGRYLYFSSQRSPGITYEVEGPFLGANVGALGPLSGLVLTGALALVATRGLARGGYRLASESIEDPAGRLDAHPAPSR